MKYRKKLQGTSLLLLGLVVVMIFSIQQAQALGFIDYSKELFEQAQQKDKVIVLHVGTTWCTVCQYQKHVLQKEAVHEKFSDVLLMSIDFDTQRDIAESYGAFQRSTIVIYKGTVQKNILINENSGDAILKAVAKSLEAEKQ